MEQRIQFWSCGGGTQSAAIAAAIDGGLPRPDLIAIADTERERSSVWDYLDQVVSPALKKIGLKIERVKRSDFAKEDLWEDWGGAEPQMLMPVFISNPDGSTGRLKTYCSSRWKRRVIMRWLRSQGVKECDAWYGITLDEVRRVRASTERWYQHRYPLIFDLPMRRNEAIRLVEKFGWPTPPRSACWMCPNREDAEWMDMKKNYPSDFASAVALEKEMQLRRPDFFLHRSLQPLDIVDFEKAQFTMFRGDGDYSCTEGCFT